MSQQDAIEVLRRMFAEGIEMTSPRATEWLRRNLKNIGTVNPASIIRTSGTESSITRFVPGSIYLFGYSPKTKIELPYYDLFPIVLVLNYAENGFIGLNFHYLHPVDRQIFFNLLVAYLNDENFDENPNAYFDISYATLKATKGLKYYRPAIKRYYYKNVVTKITEIPPIYWKFMLFLPLERFSKEIKENVWKESRRKI
jgi:hypothetical protein